MAKKAKATTTDKPDNRAKIIEEALDRLKTLASSQVTPEDSDKPQPVNIQIEICGKWIWIDGETRIVKEQLKEIGCLWSPNKAKWYWRSPENKRYARGNFSMPKIRDTFGSHTVDTETQQPG